MTQRERLPETPVTPPAALPPLDGCAIRVAYVQLVRDRHCWRWCIPRCPFCGKSHAEYAAPLHADPWLRCEGYHVARCDRTDRRRLQLELGTDSLWYQLVPQALPGHLPARAERGAPML